MVQRVAGRGRERGRKGREVYSGPVCCVNIFIETHTHTLALCTCNLLETITGAMVQVAGEGQGWGEGGVCGGRTVVENGGRCTGVLFAALIYCLNTHTLWH